MMDIERISTNKITDKILECAEKVIEVLGCGFEAKVYERALTYELSRQRFNLESQYPINVYYEGIIVGEFYADILVQESVLVEIIAVDHLTEQHKKKCLNHLKASGLKVCLLINFGVTELEVYQC